MPRENIVLSEMCKLSDKSINTVADVIDMPFNVFFNAANCEIREASDTCLDSFGFYSKSDAIGYSIAKVVPDQVQVMRVYKNDKQVMAKNQMMVFEEYVDLRDDKSVQAVSFKMPWYNKNNQVVGVFGCSVVVDQDTLDNIPSHFYTISRIFSLPDISVKSLLSGREINGKYFSAREVDVMQCIICRKTMREIGQLLEVPSRTVELYFNNIKAKLGVNTRAELIDSVVDSFLAL